MQITSTPRQLRTPGFNPGHKRVEKPTDYVGELATTGKDVGIAVIDSGIYNHPDIDKNLSAAVTFYSDTVPDQDEWGHGTGTAGIIVGSGVASDGEIMGVAPGAKVLNLQVLTKRKNADANEGISAMLAAVDWTVENKEKFNIRVINISGALAPIPQYDANGQISHFLDPISSSIKRAVEAGIVVVAAAGNDGPNPGTVWGTPNHSPDVITVGSLDTNGTPENLQDDFVAAHSSRGPTITGLVKPDLVAPGVAILMPASPGSDIVKDNAALAAKYQVMQGVPDQDLLLFLSQAVAGKQLPSSPFAAALPELTRLLPEQFQATLNKVPGQAQAAMALRLTGALSAKGAINPESESFKEAIVAVRKAAEALAPKATFGDLGDGQPAYMAQDGTSFAAPIVSSIVAHMFEVNPNLTPAEVKEILMSTARPVPGADKYSAGAGALDAQKAIARAKAMVG